MAINNAADVLAASMEQSGIKRIFPGLGIDPDPDVIRVYRWK